MASILSWKSSIGAFRSAKINEADIISTWAGLRPLVADPKGRPSDISRAHEIRMGEPGWIDVTGGKLTTYRLMAEQTVDRAIKHLNISAAKCQTGAPSFAQRCAESTQLSGTIPPQPSQEAPVEHFCHSEWAVHLDDVLIRRSGWHQYLGGDPSLGSRAAFVIG